MDFANYTCRGILFLSILLNTKLLNKVKHTFCT